jgi:hypothetical protein
MHLHRLLPEEKLPLVGVSAKNVKMLLSLFALNCCCFLSSFFFFFFGGVEVEVCGVSFSVTRLCAMSSSENRELGSNQVE